MFPDRTVPLLREQSTYIAVLVGVGVVALTVQFGLRPFIGPAVGTLLGALLAVALCSNRSVGTAAAGSNPVDWRVTWSVTLLYVTGVFLSYQQTVWSRPTVHYVLFGGIIGYLGYQIHRGQPRSHLLAQLVVVAFVTYWSSQLAFPAGAVSADTPGIIEGMERSHESGRIVDGVPYANTPTQLLMVIQVVDIVGISYEFAYAFLATMLLVATIPLVGSMHRAFPSIAPNVALYAAMIFPIISFTLNRGLFPHKNNFFKLLIFIVILVVVSLMFKRGNRPAWLAVGLVAFAALVTGHTFSTGAAIFIVGSLLLFKSATVLNSVVEFGYTDQPSTFPFAFVGGLMLTLLSYSMYVGGGLLTRLGRSVLAVVSPIVGGTESGVPGGSSGGRYETIDAVTLFVSTSSEMLIFLLSVFGIVLAVRRSRFDMDMILCWIAVGFGLIAFGLFLNALDVPIQRIYELLALFGLNIMIAIALVELVHKTPVDATGAVVFGLLFVVAVVFLASPIAGVALSPLSDEIPDGREYETAPNSQGIEWVSTTVDRELLRMDVPQHDHQLTSAGTDQTVMIDRTVIEPGELYMFNELGVRSGVFVESDTDGRVLGGRDIQFLAPNPATQQDNRIYTNEQILLYERT